MQRSNAVEIIADIPFYTEGPATDSKGNIYFTTLSGGTILKADTEGNISEWAKSPCPNGQIVLPGGDHLICDSKLGVLRRYDAYGRFIKNETENRCSDEQVHSPNDLVADGDRNIYFTDSVRENGKVYLLRADRSLVMVASRLDYPNGIALSHRYRRLYVAESYQNRILKINLDSAGMAAEEISVFAQLPHHSSGRIEDNLPDGLALDDDENLWVAHYGMQAIQVLSAEGKLISSIDTTLPLTSNLFFTGKKKLTVTGGYKEPGPGALMNIRI